MLYGFNAKQALQAARTLASWEDSEAQGLVRLRCEIDTDADVSWMDAKQWDGMAYGSIGEYRLPECECCGLQSDWMVASSVWGHIGYNDVLDPFENCYIVDIMAETLDALERALDARETVKA